MLNHKKTFYFVYPIYFLLYIQHYLFVYFSRYNNYYCQFEKHIVLNILYGFRFYKYYSITLIDHILSIRFSATTKHIPKNSSPEVSIAEEHLEEQ